jgi:hypothetical protein
VSNIKIYFVEIAFGNEVKGENKTPGTKTLIFADNVNGGERQKGY